MTLLVKTEDVIVPDYMTPPVWHKLRGAAKHIERGSIRPIEVEVTEGGYIIRDGYARFLAAKKLGLTEHEAIIWTGTVSAKDHTDSQK